MKKYYFISGLRRTIWICSEHYLSGKAFIGNKKPKLFETKQEAKDFMKTNEFKFLDSMVPCEWHIEKCELIEREDLKESKK